MEMVCRLCPSSPAFVCEIGHRVDMILQSQQMSDGLCRKAKEMYDYSSRNFAEVFA